MNAFNRFVFLIVALLLIAVPVLLILIAFQVVPPGVLRYTGYQPAAQWISNLSESSLTTVARVVVAVVGILLALISLLLLLRELTFGQRIARSTKMDDTPGRETVITAGAVRTLTEGAAREVGAASPSTSLSSHKGSYSVSCKINVPEPSNFSELATRTRENVRRVLDGQGVPVREVEVTVQGTASQ